jgi:predicted small metal-binding protein
LVRILKVCISIRNRCVDGLDEWHSWAKGKITYYLIFDIQYQGEKMVTFRCKDIGYNCAFEVTNVTEDEALKAANEHVQKCHGIPEIPPEGIRRLRAQWAKESHPEK